MREPSRSPRSTFGLPAEVHRAGRYLWRRPAFTITTVLTLSLGIGATTSVFAVASGVLFRPLPWPDADRIVTVRRIASDRSGVAGATRGVAVSWSDWQVLRGSPHFSAVGAWQPAEFAVGVDRSEITTVLNCSAAVADVFGVRPLLGRFFRPDEDTVAEPVAVLSHDAWQRRFGGRPDVLGHAVLLGPRAASGRQMPYAIVGVLPPGTQIGTDTADFLVPIGLLPPSFREPHRQILNVAGRLAPGARLRAAVAHVGSVLGNADSTAGPAKTAPLAEDVTGTVARPLWLLFVASATLLAVSCATVAGLILGESRRRRHEIAARIALGCTRRRVLQHLMVEHVLLAMAGAAGGLALAMWLTPACVALAPALPAAAIVTIDLRVVVFAMLAGLVTVLAFGVPPGIALALTPPAEVLAEGGRGGHGIRQRRGQRVVVTVEVALALVLIVAAGLLSQTLSHLLARPLGFVPDQLAAMSVTMTRTTVLPWTSDLRRASALEMEAAVDRLAIEGRALHTANLLDRLSAVPGVVSVAGADAVPFGAPPSSVELQVSGRSGDPVIARQVIVTAGYFATVRTPILRGRDFDSKAPRGRTAVVSVEFERQFLDGRGVGRQFTIANTSFPPVTVIGVVPDGRWREFGERPMPVFYRTGGAANQLIARVAGDPTLLLPSLRQAVRDYDPQSVVTSSTVIADQVRRSVIDDRFRMAISLVFGGIALVLAGVGVFSLSARFVADQRRELAVRLALGATRSDIFGLLLRDSAVTALMGAALGVPAAFIAAQLLRRYLFGVSAADPAFYVVAAVVLGAATLTAAVGPAYRASRIDPMTTLREG